MRLVAIASLGCAALIACSSNNQSNSSESGGAPAYAGMTSVVGTTESGGASNLIGSNGGTMSAPGSGDALNSGNGNTANMGGVGNFPGGGSGNLPSGGAADVPGGGSGNMGGSGNTAGTGAGAGGAGPIPGEPMVVNGCGNAKIYQADPDPTKSGPWPVGVKTMHVTLPGTGNGYSMAVETWYPAVFGSDVGKSAASWDLTAWLDPMQAMHIPASANAPAVCDYTALGGGKCVRDLPLDGSHGPYPVVVFVHGTGSFRVANSSTMTAWASRGFIVLAADHPVLGLLDFLGAGCGKPTGVTVQDIGRDFDAMIDAVKNKTGDFAFFGTAADTSRLGISGHSQGASNAATLGSRPGIQVDMPFADLGGPAVAGKQKGVLLVGGANDTVVPYTSDVTAYGSSAADKKYLVGITAGNHLDVTDLCWQTNSQHQTGLQVANMYFTNCAPLVLLNGLAQCGTMPDPKKGPAITNYASTAVLEQALNCMDRSDAFAQLKTRYPEVSGYQHSP